MSQQQNILKRSHKADFSGVNRERSFVKTNNKEKRRSQTFVKPAIEIYRPPNVRSDLSPSSGKLNVHAKEFTMAQEEQNLPSSLLVQSSKSSGHVNIIQQQHYHHYQQHQHNSLQHSKSSGSILKSPPGTWQFIPVPAGLHMPAHTGLLHSNSTSTLLQHLHHHNQQQQIAAAQHRVTFQQQQQQMYGQQPFSCLYPATSCAPTADPVPTTLTNVPPTFRNQPGAGLMPYHVNGNQHTNVLLKRSKSFTTGAPDHQSTILPSTRHHLPKNLSNITEHISTQFPSSSFPTVPLLTRHSSVASIPPQLEDLLLTYPTEEERQSLRLAVDDPQQLPSRTLMDLVRVIMERLVQEGMTYAESAAKLCDAIAAREKESDRETFVESLVNTCQQWYQERDRILRSIKSGDGTRFTAFMWFITELFTRLKRHQHTTTTTPTTNNDDKYQQTTDLILLSILAKCCQACVSHPIRCLAETECLFFVLTSIGRELEQELPQQLDELMASVRDGFLDSSGSSAVRKTLLQLIELHASNWQLTGSSVLYYYPRIK